MAVFILPVFASAATSPGVKPGNFFYFFDTSFEKIGLFFTFSPEKKARRALQYADERLAEIEVIAEEKDTDAVKTAISNYENNVALAAEKSKEVTDKAKAENLLTSIENNAEKNQEVLSVVLTKVPEEAREAILRAISASRKGQEEAAKQIAELKGEVEKLKQEVEELKKEAGDPRADEVEKLKKEVEELKKRQANDKKMEIINPNEKNIIQTPKLTPPPSYKIEGSGLQENYKLQAVTILNFSKENFVKLISFTRDCALMAADRKSRLILLSVDREKDISQVSFDSYLLKLTTLYYDLFASEIENISIYQRRCEIDYYNVFNDNINKVDAMIDYLKQPDTAVTLEQLVDYQQKWLDPRTFEDFRNAVQIVVDKMNNMINQTNPVYRTALEKMSNYISGVMSDSTYSVPTYNLPPAPILPTLPKTTNCTISGDGGVGLQTYLSCTTY